MFFCSYNTPLTFFKVLSAISVVFSVPTTLFASAQETRMQRKMCLYTVSVYVYYKNGQGS